MGESRRTSRTPRTPRAPEGFRLPRAPSPPIPRAPSPSRSSQYDQNTITVTEYPSDSEGQGDVRSYDSKKKKASKSKDSKSRPSSSKHSSSRDSKKAPSTAYETESNSTIRPEREKKKYYDNGPSLPTVDEQTTGRQSTIPIRTSRPSDEPTRTSTKPKTKKSRSHTPTQHTSTSRPTEPLDTDLVLPEDSISCIGGRKTEAQIDREIRKIKEAQSKTRRHHRTPSSASRNESDQNSASYSKVRSHRPSRDSRIYDEPDQSYADRKSDRTARTTKGKSSRRESVSNEDMRQVSSRGEGSQASSSPSDEESKYHNDHQESVRGAIVKHRDRAESSDGGGSQSPDSYYGDGGGEYPSTRRSHHSSRKHTTSNEPRRSYAGKEFSEFDTDDRGNMWEQDMANGARPPREYSYESDSYQSRDEYERRHRKGRAREAIDAKKGRRLNMPPAMPPTMYPNMHPNMHPTMPPTMHPNMHPTMPPTMHPNMHATQYQTRPPGEHLDFNPRARTGYGVYQSSSVRQGVRVESHQSHQSHHSSHHRSRHRYDDYDYD
ncbi:hypothetical protein BcDW1_6162 [Botrytis cinerea BcDW1]|uniref:Uncharacterized protein n=1 Tax=Botryotinia fuckeliana (strain BcDW1) TaxID=1290391 RepID=M7UNC5_BOTF1|nr:hypothetical protein BcDW1_6162 [Botrytis cinerea BcDW1]